MLPRLALLGALLALGALALLLLRALVLHIHRVVVRRAAGLRVLPVRLRQGFARLGDDDGRG